MSMVGADGGGTPFFAFISFYLHIDIGNDMHDQQKGIM